MAATIEPPGLARLADLAEHPRRHGWSLRAALVRYAQPEPVRAGAVLEVVRRVDAALKPHARTLAKQGEAVWAALEGGAAGDDAAELADLVALLGAARPLDALGDVLDGWAVDPRRPRPDRDVDEAVAATAGRLDELGVPREARPDARARPRRRPRG